MPEARKPRHHSIVCLTGCISPQFLVWYMPTVREVIKAERSSFSLRNVRGGGPQLRSSRSVEMAASLAAMTYSEVVSRARRGVRVHACIEGF